MITKFFNVYTSSIWTTLGLRVFFTLARSLYRVIASCTLNFFLFFHRRFTLVASSVKRLTTRTCRGRIWGRNYNSRKQGEVKLFCMRTKHCLWNSEALCWRPLEKLYTIFSFTSNYLIEEFSSGAQVCFVFPLLGRNSCGYWSDPIWQNAFSHVTRHGMPRCTIQVNISSNWCAIR